jgi:hypothetical protein
VPQLNASRTSQITQRIHLENKSSLARNKKKEVKLWNRTLCPLNTFFLAFQRIAKANASGKDQAQNK